MLGIPPNPLFSAFAFTGFLLAGIPLPWHIKCKSFRSKLFDRRFINSTRCSMEYGDQHVHALDKPRVSHFICQLHRVER